MRGANIKYKHLCQLLKEGRERKHIDPEEAVMILGLTNSQYLWRCEHGISNFPATVIKRALDLYHIPVFDAVEAAQKDFFESVTEFLNSK